MGLRERIGGARGGMRLEDALDWAGAHNVHFLDFAVDQGPNHLSSWTDQRAAAVREACNRRDIHVGIHTLSGVNVAEFAPHVSEGVDRYLTACVDLAVRLGCEWTTVHGGFHFSDSLEARKQASLDRLTRLVTYAESKDARIVLENLNFEPDDAEVHYLAHNLDEVSFYLDAIPSGSLDLAWAANHENLVPEGVLGFLDGFLARYGIDRIHHVLLADNRGLFEEHLLPGEGNIDFKSLLQKLESAGYQGHYLLTFGGLEDKLKFRETFVGYVQESATGAS